MKIQFTGKVEETGRLHIYNRKKFAESLSAFLCKDVVITVERKKRKRSLSQNAYLHGIVIPMAKEGLLDVGYRLSTQETKDLLKSKFAIFEKVNEETGEILEYVKGTSDMTTTELMVLIKQIQQWASEFLGIVIPDPGEQIEIEI